MTHRPFKPAAPPVLAPRVLAITVAIALGAPGCQSMDDNSLEPPTFAGAGLEEGESTFSGTLSTTPQSEEGDWELMIGESVLDYHSPSHVDPSGYAGRPVTATGSGLLGDAPAFALSDASGPALVVSVGTAWDGGSGDDGTSVFGYPVWTRGQTLGRGTVTDAYDEPLDVTFTRVAVAADDGEVQLAPGVPTTVRIAGENWRFTVVASYLARNPPHMKCGSPDMLAVELMRTDDAPGDALVRPVDLRAPVGSCG